MIETRNHPPTATQFRLSPVWALVRRQRGRRLTLFTVAAIAFMAFAHGAYPQDSQPDAVVPCGSTISTCGCTITKRGFFQVTAALKSSQGLTALNGCIDIKASNVTLNTGEETSRGHKTFDAFPITGPGGATPTGIGIHILKGSNNDFVELPSDVDGWDVGVLVEGDNNIVEDFNTNNNGTAGFEINEGKNNNINDFSSTSNKNYGAWIRGGSNNQINCSNTIDNGNVGVFIGCSSDGPIDAACSRKKSPVSKSNKIFDHDASDNGHFGVAIDLGNTGNDVSDVSAQSNGTEDMMDENSGCDSDLWYFNSFTNAMPSCVD